MPIRFMSFCSNTPCQCRALLHLHSLMDTNQIKDSSNIRLNYDKTTYENRHYSTDHTHPLHATQIFWTTNSLRQLTVSLQCRLMRTLTVIHGAISTQLTSIVLSIIILIYQNGVTAPLPSGSTVLAICRASDVARSVLAGVTARIRQVSFVIN